MNRHLSIKPDWFLVTLLVTLVVALIWPQPGMTHGPLHLELVASYGVVGVFFFYGLTLAPEQMRQGLANWRVHMLVQAGTFVFFPAIVLVGSRLFAGYVSGPVLTGFFYLAVLPSTISSSVALTSMAKGNVAAAIFNASLSSLIGVVVTPIAIAWILHTNGEAVGLVPVFEKIILLVILPMVVGQFLHRPLLRWSSRHGSKVKLVDRVIILAIVLNSLSDAAGGGLWKATGPAVLASIAVACVGLFLTVYAVLWTISGALGLPPEDRIAVVFCGSKKSLATGIPMAGILFGTGPQVGLIVTPLIMFHFFQLLIVSFIAGGVAIRSARTFDKNNLTNEHQRA